ncbi:MAG: ORF6N domain-containing protein [Alphaproteobacteria bacterium]|nr:ORF6N domain-containing protein [Alphaproteobacteria bacterium]
MASEIAIHNTESLKDKIYTIRGVQVMLDSDLAEIYGYATKDFNRQVKNNIERFDEDFRFQLTDEEVTLISRCKNFTLNDLPKGRGHNYKYKPYAFTEQGIYMLMSVLKGDLAVAQSKTLIRLFREMKHFVQNNMLVFDEIVSIKQHQLNTDKRVDELFTLLDKYNVKDTQGIFYQGQIFDAYAKFQSFIAQAQTEIILIDNYVDVSVLERLATKNSGVAVTIYTSNNAKITAQDIQNFNAQYPPLTVHYTTNMHDRFLIIDHKILYHIGASLKDLGKKCFAFDLFDASFIPDILAKI